MLGMPYKWARRVVILAVVCLGGVGYYYYSQLAKLRKPSVQNASGDNLVAAQKKAEYEAEVRKLITHLIPSPSSQNNSDPLQNNSYSSQNESVVVALGVAVRISEKLMGLKRLIEDVINHDLDGDFYVIDASSQSSIFMVVVMQLYARLAEKTFYNRHLYFFYSSGGFPHMSHFDELRSADPHVSQFELLNTTFQQFEVASDRVHFIQGLFDHTVLAQKITRPIALLHLDGDVCKSTKVILERFYTAVQNCGWVVVASYDVMQNNKTECREAVHEFRAARNILEGIKRGRKSGGIPCWRNHLPDSSCRVLRRSERLRSSL